MTVPPSLVWFRLDLRLADNPALLAAARGDAPVAALFLLDDEEAGRWRPGAAARWWLHHSLSSLAGRLRQRGIPLILRRGPATVLVPAVAAELGAGAIFWNRCYEPWRVARDRMVEQRLKERGLAVESFNAALLHEPWTVTTPQGRPYSVFSPFWRALQQRAVAPPAPEPGRLRGLEGGSGEALGDWGLPAGTTDVAGSLRENWTPGEAAALARLKSFVDDRLEDYSELRDRPDLEGGSRLSPHLHFGEVGPRQVWTAVQDALQRRGGTRLERSASKFLSELAWREFSHHLLHHAPHLPEQPWQESFAVFPWRDDSAAFEAWCQGRTGYPVVDAGLRQLYATGWLPNRVRMIAASFLVKDLLIPWQRGEIWFRERLVDADLASNAANWQWVAGCGADAAPYFRIFNPVLQGEKFDPRGTYVRRWVPELEALADGHLHKPWQAPESILAAAGLRLGRDYPEPLVEHGWARRRALAAFGEVRSRAAG